MSIYYYEYQLVNFLLRNSFHVSKLFINEPVGHRLCHILPIKDQTMRVTHKRAPLLTCKSSYNPLSRRSGIS